MGWWRKAGYAACLMAWAALVGNAYGASPAVQASGVFINMRGDVLTARHAVLGCPSLYVTKNGRVGAARLLVVGSEADVAVLQTQMKPLLAATFSQAALPDDHSVAVFSEAYTELQHMQDRSRVLGNALTVPGKPGSLQMVSGVRPGTSGSGVLDSGGLLIGIVVERMAAGNGGSAAELGASHVNARAGMATIVRAVPSAAIRQFLAESAIPYAESKSAQIGSYQSPASRASTLAVGVLCG